MDRRLWQTVLHTVLMCSLLLATGGGAASAMAARFRDLVSTNPAPAATVIFEPNTIETFNFTAISAGWGHTCALTAGGGVKCWGNNGNGQLGNGTTTDSSLPVDVFGLSNGVTTIAAGGYHTCALLVGGGIKCWGYNNTGMLGNGTNTSSSIPVDVIGLGGNATAITTGTYHTCALLAVGSVHSVQCWGNNDYGQLGIGPSPSSNVPVDVFLYWYATAIDTGGNHTCAWSAGGSASCWGLNNYGQLGDGTKINRNYPVDVSGLGGNVSVISAGGHHTCALITGGTAKCWGHGYYGQLGNGTNTSSSIPVSVSGLASGVLAISSGGSHTCVLVPGGAAKCWGANANGALGNGNTTNSNVPVDVTGLTSGITAIGAGGYHTCAMLLAGGVKCWGFRKYGQLGDGTLVWRSLPVTPMGLTDGITAIAEGDWHTCVVTQGEGAKCWGNNGYGQLGDGTTLQHSLPVDVSGLTSGVLAVAAGSYHSCALVAGGGVKCWGENWSGQLGNGTYSASYTPVDVSGLSSGVIAISTGIEHTCALTSGGAVKCWGQNIYGQLGDGTYNWSSIPVAVSGLGSGVTAISAGGDHTCAVAAGGAATCWGNNEFGQLGNGMTTHSNLPVSVTGLSGGVAAIVAAGEYDGEHTCALVAGGVKCWGHNVYGQLGNNTTTNSSTPVDVTGLASGATAIAAGWFHSCALLTGGAMKCWGNNRSGQLGDGTTVHSKIPVAVTGLSSGATAVSAGGYQTCALAGAGRALCWGSDNSGQLGVGSMLFSTLPGSVVESASPFLTINYPSGQPGSFFTVSGWNFPPGAAATLVVNGQVLTTSLLVNPTGSFIFFLNSAGAAQGAYQVTVSTNPSAWIGFTLANVAPLRPQEGGGQTFVIPAGVAYQLLYFPILRR